MLHEGLHPHMSGDTILTTETFTDTTLYTSLITPETLDIASMHRLVMAGFDLDPELQNARSVHNILYRLNPDGTVIVQSTLEPQNWSDLVPDFKVRDWNTNVITEGKTYRFEMCFNSVAQFAKQNNRRVNISPEKWLERRNLGAELELTDTTHNHVNDNSKNRHFRLRLTTVCGTLTIIDIERFTKYLVKGIGKAKSYGAGLISLAPY